MVGTHLCEELCKAGHQVVRVARSSKTADARVDATDEEALERLIGRARPEVVVNAVKPALSTDRMEEERELTSELNARLPERLAKMQKKHGYRLVQISTDWVYEGKQGEEYDEDSPLKASNHYAATKLEAEKAIMKNAADYLIVRTEGVFGIDEKGSNIFMRLRKAVETGEEFQAATDQYSQPICGMELARVIRGLIEKGAKGIFNVVGPTYVSRYEFAAEACNVMGWKCRLKPVSIKGRKIRMPSHLKVDISKVQEIVGSIRPLDEQITMLKEEL